jgi:hypothetical protein
MRPCSSVLGEERSLYLRHTGIAGNSTHYSDRGPDEGEREERGEAAHAFRFLRLARLSPVLPSLRFLEKGTSAAAGDESEERRELISWKTGEEMTSMSIMISLSSALWRR